MLTGRNGCCITHSMKNKGPSGQVTSIRLNVEERRQADLIKRAGKHKSRSAAIKAAIGIVARMAA